MDERGLRLDDLLRMVRRRSRLILFPAGALVLMAIFVASVLPNRYVAHTTMLVEPQTISKRLVETGLEQSDLSNRLHLMTMQILSRARLSKVIDDLQLYVDRQDDETRAEIIDYMRSQIWVEPVLPELESGIARRNQDVEINTFRMFFRHESPTLAASVANRLADDFIAEHIRDRVQVSGDTAEFIEAEQVRLAQRLREIEAQIAQIKAENPGSLPEDRTSNEMQMTRALDAMRESQRRLAEAQSDAAFFQQQASVARVSEGQRGDVVGRAVTPALRLQELEIRLSELRARGLTNRHPDVVITRAEIDELRAKVDSDDPDQAPVSVAEQEAKAQVQRAQLRAQAEQEEVARQQEAIRDLEQRLANTPRVAERLDALALEYESVSGNFQNYSNKRLEASVAANMERRQKGEQFRVLESAVPPPDPVSPNRPAILLVGTLLGLAFGAGLALLAEASDSSYHDPRSIQERLRIPVLVSIPSIVLQSDRAASRRRRRREAMAAVAVSGILLLASAVGYVWVNVPGFLGREGAGPPAATDAADAPARAPAAGTPAPSPSDG